MHLGAKPIDVREVGLAIIGLATVFQMDDKRIPYHQQTTRFSQSVAPLIIFAVHKKTLVQRPHLRNYRRAGHQTGPRKPLNLIGFVVNRFRDEPMHQFGQERRVWENEKMPAQLGKRVENGVVNLALAVDLHGTHARHFGPRIHQRHQLRQYVVDKQRVGVEQKYIPTPGVLNTPVAGPAKPRIIPHLKPAHRRKSSLNPGFAVVARLIIDHQNLNCYAFGVFIQRLKAVEKQIGGFVVN